MLLEIAIGDAYGAGFEYVSKGALAQNDLSRYVAHERHRLAPGAYTDDTQMSLAIAELLVSGAPFTREAIAEKFVAAFHRDPREGYARGFHAFLSTTKSGAEFLANIRPDSKKSGAAMRAAPLGVLRDERDVIERTRTQAKLTHDTEEGTNAAIAAALMAHYLFHDRGEKAALPRYLAERVAGEWERPWRGKVGEEGMESTRAALTAVLAHDSLSSILKASIAFGGDVDTVAAIAMGAAAHAKEVASDLPNALVDGLEDGAYGRAYIRDLDAKLLALSRV